MNKRKENYYALIMAGGVGSRFWPVSKAQHPKQFQDMMGVGETLLQLTYNRLATIVEPQNILILTNVAYKELVLEQLPKISEEQVLMEPAMRNTAPCILLAAMKIKKLDPEAVMLIAPSDHWIEDKEAFINNVNQGFQAAEEKDILVTLGIKPTFPHTGYGYIKYEEPESKREGFELQKVLKFAEKPTLRNARKYLEDGNYVWNAGIFIWKASFIVDSFKKYCPEMLSLFAEGEEKLNEAGEEGFVDEVYPKAQNISIDYAILEKSESVYVIPATFDWDDLGTWGALYSKLAKDHGKNAVVNAQLMPRDAKNNMVYTKDYKIVVLDGLEDFIVVDDEDVLLIVPKEKEQKIKEIRAAAIEKFGDKIG